MRVAFVQIARMHHSRCWCKTHLSRRPFSEAFAIKWKIIAYRIINDIKIFFYSLGLIQLTEIWRVSADTSSPFCKVSRLVKGWGGGEGWGLHFNRKIRHSRSSLLFLFLLRFIFISYPIDCAFPFFFSLTSSHFYCLRRNIASKMQDDHFLICFRDVSTTRVPDLIVINAQPKMSVFFLIMAIFLWKIWRKGKWRIKVKGLTSFNAKKF